MNIHTFDIPCTITFEYSPEELPSFYEPGSQEEFNVISVMLDNVDVVDYIGDSQWEWFEEALKKAIFEGMRDEQ